MYFAFNFFYIKMYFVSVKYLIFTLILTFIYFLGKVQAAKN
jgi:hypothetical protein